MSDFLNKMFAEAELCDVSAGSSLFFAGDPVRFIHLIESGAIHLERTQINGQVTCFQRAQSGDILAEASLYARAYHCDAKVVQQTRLRRLPIAQFSKRLGSDLALSEAWAARLARTVQKTRLLAEIRSFKTVEQRLDAWIDEYGALPAKGQWQDVAQELAVTREALYREMARRRAGRKSWREKA